MKIVLFREFLLKSAEQLKRKRKESTHMKRLEPKRIKFKPDKNQEQHRNDPKGLLTDEVKRQVYELCLLKCTDKEIAKVINVADKTFQYWKRHKPEFVEIMKMGKEGADGQVALTLLQRALGYDYQEEHHVQGIGQNGTPYYYTKTINKKVLPDVGAMCFWLKNRQRGLWKDAYQVEQGGTINHKVDLSGLDEKEKELVKSISLKQINDEQHN